MLTKRLKKLDEKYERDYLEKILDIDRKYLNTFLINWLNYQTHNKLVEKLTDYLWKDFSELIKKDERTFYNIKNKPWKQNTTLTE